jgi:hypothetical protein
MRYRQSLDIQIKELKKYNICHIEARESTKNISQFTPEEAKEIKKNT